MTTEPSTRPIARPALEAAAQAAARQIPPLWPLASSVAVNPFLGQVTNTLAATGARLARVGGIAATMSREWYRERLERGEISDVDLSAALGACPHDGAPRDIAALRTAVSLDRTPPMALPTIADLVRDSEGTDWPGAIADRIGVWAAGYFDRGQALWAAPRGRSAWTSWKAYAAHDLTPEIMGLDGFGPYVVYAPESAAEAVTRAVDRLGLGEASLDTYFHQLLLSLGGWAQFARYELWRAELENQTNSTITDLLAIRLLWEEALFDRNELAIGEEWTAVRKAHAAPLAPSEDDIIGEILQEAAERAGQRGLAQTLAKAGPTISPYRPALQVAFCIDVRSEVFRRALEAIDPSIRTLGFAGFFGVLTKHRRFASDAEELRLPVLLNPIVTSSAGGKDRSLADLSARYTARAKRAWGRFKLAAVSSFAFVEAAGPIYVVKLLRDALGFNPAPPPDDDAPRFDPELDLETRIGAAETVLRAMSLTDDFARLILLAGHGANGVNNPFKSGLHCGACGGYSGDVNARLLAGLLNDADVRGGLVVRGITVPDHTLFVGALHDTTTDRVTLYDCDVAAEGHIADLKQARQWLEAAAKVTCTERALRLPGTKGVGDISVRSRNWAEVRPEWALAGCQAFIAAPRGRTTGRSLEGRAFLHDYDWRQDSAKGFAVLELIMTAPVVVASWISLQYYGSTVAPATFGAGNKLLHNVVGGIGVFEGNGGQMRAGLPWQSVHDGERHMHDPLRLSVCIEAPRDAMSEILRQHPDVRALFDNRWLHLFAIDDHGRLAYRYLGNLQWEAVAASTDHQPLRNVA